MFNSSTLFSDEEKMKIKEFADEFSEKNKKELILTLLNKTIEPRKRKILLYLNKLGIKFYESRNNKVVLSEEIIGNIIEQRNKLFHGSAIFDEELLWFHLFPIAKEIVSLVINNPDSLDI